MADSKNKEELFRRIRQAVLTFDDKLCEKLCNRVLEENMDPVEAIREGLAGGMTDVGETYRKGEYFIPELLLCSDALYAGLNILQPHLKQSAAAETSGKIIIGVVQGDIHDIGKNLVKAMFSASGWTVHDLGSDVPCERFVSVNLEVNADIVGLSALMTTSMMAMPRLIRELHEKTPDTRVMVGGAPLTRAVAEKFGADGYAQDVLGAVREAERLIHQ